MLKEAGFGEKCGKLSAGAEALRQEPGLRSIGNGHLQHSQNDVTPDLVRGNASCMNCVLLKVHIGCIRGGPAWVQHRNNGNVVKE